MDRVIEMLNKYVDTCATCFSFITGRCGYVDESVNHRMVGEDEYFMMDEDERNAYSTQISHQPCQEQIIEPVLLKNIAECLNDADIYLTEDWLVTTISKLYAVKTKVEQKDDLFRNRFVGPIHNAIEAILAKIDMVFLQEHIEIREFVEMAGLDYDRYSCMSKICPLPFIKRYEKKAKPFADEGEPQLPPVPELEYLDTKPSKGQNKSQEKANADLPQKYHLEIPKNISAVDELILRFGGWDGSHPITALLIKAGYGQFVWGDMWEIEGISQEQWADVHSEEWKRFEYTRFDELREEMSAEIKKRVGDELELKKYICGLITPFDRYQYYGHIMTDIREIIEARAFIDCFSEQFFRSSDEYIPIWKKMVEGMREKYPDEDFSEDDYLVALYKEADNMLKGSTPDSEHPEAVAYDIRRELPEKFAGMIAGCLLENGAKKEYMDYQDMCGVDLVPHLTSTEVAMAMNWTEGLVFSYNPKRVVESGCELCQTNEVDNYDRESTDAILAGRPATEHFLSLYCNNTIAKYLWAITGLLGFEPDFSIRNWNYDEIHSEEDLKMYQEDFVFPQFKRFKELVSEISRKIKELKSDSVELDNYVFSLLRPLASICEYIYPVPSDWRHRRGAKAIVLFATARQYDIDEFGNMWREVADCVSRNPGQHSTSTSTLPEIFYKSYQDCADGIRIPINDGDAAKVSGIIDSLNIYASIIEGALLKNGVKTDLIYYQESSGIIAAPVLEDWMIANHLGWTEAQVETYFKKYKHRRSMPNDNDNQSEASTDKGTTGVSFGDIEMVPEEFRSPKAIKIWEKAFEKGFIDANFKFIGKRTELAMFAANLSHALFGTNNWIAIQRWNDYKYYAKTYGEISGKTIDQQTKRIQEIIELFE